jgi:predicted nucleic acid-binding protein
VKALLDTCVVTEIGKANGNPLVKSVVAEIATPNLYLSVLTVGEIAKGIALLKASRKKATLSTWLARVENQYADRILSIDVETARIWGELTARAQRNGITIPGTDGLLAATALRHGLHVITRNTKHFEASGALVLNPWQGS